LPVNFKKSAINRIIDANINRTKEGLRVLEEIVRFVLDDRKLTEKFKRIRHEIDDVIKRIPCGRNLLEARNSIKDVGKNIYINELKRNDLTDIFFANIQRIKESIRVLEEFSKLINETIAIKFKKIRYEIYQVEKEASKRILR
jgi:thiamine-phosphate pyrophosphorylase